MVTDMLNEIKNDRIALLLLGAVLLAFLGLLVFFTHIGYVLLNRSLDLPPAVAGPTLTPVVIQLTGSGDDVVFFDVPGSGPALITSIHRGDSNFIVELMTDDGLYIDLLVNEIGEYTGERMVNLEPNRYMLQVKADGSWGVVILPPQ